MPWRLSSDLQLVMHNKNLMSLADFVHFICTTHGVAAFDLLDHTITQKQHPPVPCREILKSKSYEWL